MDPGGDAARIFGVLKQHKLKCEQIWLTHSHIDHCGGVRQLQQLSGAKLLAHPAGREMRATVERTNEYLGVDDDSMENCPEPDTYINDQDLLQLGEHHFRALFTPGHAPDHLAFYNLQQGVLLAGDAVFAGSIGRTDLPGCDHAALIRAIRTRILTLPPETVIMSGHGPDTTVKKEAATNPFLVGEY